MLDSSRLLNPEGVMLPFSKVLCMLLSLQYNPCVCIHPHECTQGQAVKASWVREQAAGVLSTSVPGLWLKARPSNKRVSSSHVWASA